MVCSCSRWPPPAAVAAAAVGIVVVGQRGAVVDGEKNRLVLSYRCQNRVRTYYRNLHSKINTKEIQIIILKGK